MNFVEAIFLYLPVPYWAAFVLLMYRHDLSRLAHPVRDNGSLSNWWAVLSYLGLLDGRTRRPSRKEQILPYVISLSTAAGVSLSWTLRIFPLIWFYLITVQGISAIFLTAATLRYLGPPPRRPYIDVLRYPRLGSRIRHLGKVPRDKREDEPSIEPPEVQK